MYAYMHTCIKYMHPYMFIHESVHACMCTHTYIHTYIHTYVPGERVSHFKDKEDVISALLASCHIPFWVTQWPVAAFR